MGSNTRTTPVPEVDDLPPLQTVAQHTTAQTITGQAILNDFGQTADLLGAPDRLKQQLSHYMGIVRAESAQSRPDVGLIQSVLQRAATGLDGHVTQTLGQPSTVVTEWVQALLQQPIDWQSTEGSSDTAIDWGGAAPVGKTLDKPVKEQVAQALTEYQQASQAKDWPQARLAVESALTHLQPYQAPELKGKFYHLQGKVSAIQGDWSGAVTATHQAIEQQQQAGATAKIPRLWHELGRYHQQLGQPDQAKAAFEAGLSVTQQLPASQLQTMALQGQLWQGLGQLALDNRQPQAATAAFTTAIQLSPDNALKQQAALHLAATHRQNAQPALAESAYRQALSLAKQPGQVPQYRQALAQLTSLYVEQGQTHKAQRLMPYLARLSTVT
jgi:tetratricopeptide (TPR) repeat protein